jgi:hypothetical protein
MKVMLRALLIERGNWKARTMAKSSQEARDDLTAAKHEERRNLGHARSCREMHVTSHRRSHAVSSCHAACELSATSVKVSALSDINRRSGLELGSPG